MFKGKGSNLVATWKEHSGNSWKTASKSNTLISQLQQTVSETRSSPYPHGRSCQASDFFAWALREEQHGANFEIILKSPRISKCLQQACNTLQVASCIETSLRVRFSLRTFDIPVIAVCVRTLKGARLPSFLGRGMQAVWEQGEQHKQSLWTFC